MAPAPRPRPLRKDHVAAAFKSPKPTVFAENSHRSSLPPRIASVSWSPTGALLAQCTAVNIRVWNAERPDIKASSEMKDNSIRSGAHSASVEKVAFNPRSEAVLASAGQDGMVKLWDVRAPAGATGGPRGSTTLKSAEHKVGDQALFLIWHLGGTEVLVGRRDDVITALDIRKIDTALLEVGGSKYNLEATDRSPVKDKGNYHMMAFSNSGREVFATTGEGPVKVLDYPSMQQIYTLNAHTSTTYAVQHSPAGNYVAVGGSDSLISLWDTNTWMCSHVLSHHTSAVRDLSFSFDGTYLAAGCGFDKDGDKGLEIYHVDTGESVYTIETTNPVTWLAWHPLRYAVAYGGESGGLRVAGVFKD